MNRSLNRSIDRSMDEKLYSLIEANVQITNETIAQLEGENDEVRTNSYFKHNFRNLVTKRVKCNKRQKLGNK